MNGGGDTPIGKTPGPPDPTPRTARWTDRPPLPDRLLYKVLYLNDLTVSFDGFKALDALTLDVSRESCAASSDPTAPARPP